MALSEREQKLLDEMERNLREDPQFANRVSQASSSNQSSGKLVGGVLLLLVGVGLLILAVILQVAFFGVAAFLVMLMGLVIASANFSLPKMPEIQKSQNPNRYEDRWNQRFNNNE